MQEGEIEHINYGMPAERPTAMYLMHKYWARKPFNVVREYITHYSNAEEIVLDPFCGSGVTAIEAVKSGRKAIAIDLNPLAVFITRVTATPVDLQEFQSFFNILKNEVKEKIDRFYAVSCPKCGGVAVTTNAVWSYVVKCPSCHNDVVMAKANRAHGKRQNIYVCYNCNRSFSYGNQPIEYEVPIKLNYQCDPCKDTGSLENPEIEDNTDLSAYWYPKVSLSYSDNKPFLTKRRAGTTEELFTKRNIACLSILREAISHINKPLYKDLMLLTFSSMLPQASRMMIWTEKSGASWKLPEYLVFGEHQEFNVWTRFENRFRAILRGKKESNAEIKAFKEANSFEDFKKDANFLTIAENALELTKGSQKLPEESIDYVFTDPPYGGDIQYFELDFVRLAWLRGRENDSRFSLDWWGDEITINESGQLKDFDYYHKMMSAAFQQIYKVLKSNRYLTVTFHNVDVKIYSYILEAGVLAGFSLEKVVYQTPNARSVKAQAQPYGSAVGDYYIRFKKSSEKSAGPETSYDVQRYTTAVIENAKKMIAERGEPTPLTHLLTMYSVLGQRGVILGAKEPIESVLTKRIGTVFELVDGNWWLKDPEKYHLDTIPLNERIERVIVDTLNAEVTVSLDEVLTRIYVNFPNSLTPGQPIKKMLEEYADKVSGPGGRYRLKIKVQERVSEHSKIIGMLAEIGNKFGFTIHIGLREQGDTYDGKPLQDFVDKEVPHLSKPVKEVDELWMTKGRVTYSFEVEYTTGITEAIIRGSYIFSDDVSRVFVIPDEREQLLFRKISAPILKDKIKQQNWRFVFFDDFKDFYLKNKKRKDLKVSEFEKLFKELKEERHDHQVTLWELEGET
ncbi:MAG: DNA methyltransferase [Halobacteriota archaeon]|jgi:16S rRNA G966 N2-methylase RsmD